MPIDLIVRCVAGAVADPLELDASGFAGPVGLLQAIRKQPDLVVNAPGTALAENRGLSAYLPKLAKAVLGEDLLVPDGPRWWLGDAASRRHALANLEHMIIRPAHEGTARPGGAIPGIDPARLGPAERAQLLQEIEIRGAALVAEAKVGFGTTPSLTPSGLVPKPYAVRMFVAATANGFTALPGGLAMTVDPDLTVALSAPDGESRDVWVVSDATLPPFTSLWRPTIEAAQVRRSPHDLPSRAADNLFWLGRYTERADWTMRTLRICLSRLQEDSAPRQELRASRIALEILLAKDDGKVPGEWEVTDAHLIEQLAQNLMTSADWYYSLPRTLDNIHRVASLTRDRLSLEAWRTLNDFYASRRWRADAMPTAMGDALHLLDDGLRVLAAFHGLTHENMTRNFGWSFLDMGRRLVARLQPLRGAARHLRQGQERRRRDRQPAVRPRARRQLHHLPLALPAGADAAAGARSAAARREQSAQRRLPARGPVAPHRYAAPVGRGQRPQRGAAHGPVAAVADAARRHGRARQARGRTARARPCRSC